MNPSKILLKAAGAFIVTFGVLVSQVFGATFYIAPTGGSDSNSGLSPSEAWTTFDHAWTKLKPGDTLILRDGTYYQSLKPTISGTQSAPITITSEHDGEAIIDGEKVHIPCYILGTSKTVRDRTDLIIEGIQCRNSNKDVVRIKYAQRITFKRVSAYNAAIGNFSIFGVTRSSDILLEDVAASLVGEKEYSAYDSQKVTFRRCWGRWAHPEAVGGTGVMSNAYGSSDNVTENCIATQDPSYSAPGMQGMSVWQQDYQQPHSSDRNKFYGNVVYGLSSHFAYQDGSHNHRMEGSQFINSVSIDTPKGFWQRGDADLKMNKMTFVNITNQGILVSPFKTELPYDPDYELNTDVRNSIQSSFGFLWR